VLALQGELVNVEGTKQQFEDVLLECPQKSNVLEHLQRTHVVLFVLPLFWLLSLLLRINLLLDGLLLLKLPIGAIHEEELRSTFLSHHLRVFATMRTLFGDVLVKLFSEQPPIV
jgi:hypothetical protein